MLFIASIVLALNASQTVPVIILVVLLGLVGFSTNPALNSRIVAIAPKAPTLSVSGNVSAFNVGIAAGPWLGGLALSAGYGYPAVAWIGAALGAIALLLWLVDLTLISRQRTISPMPIPIQPTAVHQ